MWRDPLYSPRPAAPSTRPHSVRQSPLLHQLPILRKQPLRPYPPARWRFVRQSLHEVILKVSHILIRHKESTSVLSKLRAPEWTPDNPSSRTRQDAIQLAKRVADSLRHESADFAAQARQFSEDSVTSHWGGSLGTLTAARLPTEFLDAIAAMEPGDVSEPFETELGIHIIKLHATPREESLLASRIVIAYAGGGGGVLRAGRNRTRSRTEAREIATRLAIEARRPGADFVALIRQWTDSIDVQQLGDMGVWSTYESEHLGLALEVLSNLEPGAVTDPIDSAEGFQVIKRQPMEQREWFASSYVLLSFFEDKERDEARNQMREILIAIKAAPERFAEFQNKHCCTDPLGWSRGRGPSLAVETMLQSLRVDELAPSAVETPAGYIYLLKRLDSKSVPPRRLPVSLRLPSPGEPRLDEVIRNTSPEGLKHTIKIVQQGLESAPISKDKRARLSALLDKLASELPRASGENRDDIVENFWRSTAAFLSTEEAAQFRGYVMNLVKQELMRD